VVLVVAPVAQLAMRCPEGGESVDTLLDLQGESNVLKNARRLRSCKQGCDGMSRGTGNRNTAGNLLAQDIATQNEVDILFVIVSL
jgi:hypothetical protein